MNISSLWNRFAGAIIGAAIALVLYEAYEFTVPKVQALLTSGDAVHELDRVQEEAAVRQDREARIDSIAERTRELLAQEPTSDETTQGETVELSVQ